MLSAGIASRKDTQTTHAVIILTDSMCPLQKVEWECSFKARLTVLCQCSTSLFKDSCGSAVVDVLESREMTEQTDWRAKTPVDCGGRAGVQRNDRADRLAGKDSCGSAVVDVLESREMPEQTDWRAKTPVDLLSWIIMLESREMTEQTDWLESREI